jgi:hypothetical protein
MAGSGEARRAPHALPVMVFLDQVFRFSGGGRRLIQGRSSIVRIAQELEWGIGWSANMNRTLWRNARRVAVAIVTGLAVEFLGS